MKDKYAQFTSLQADLENGVNLEQTIRIAKRSLNSTALWVR
ncbi:hypothetical protein ACLB1E_27385 [Escherichia coli]